MLALIAVDLSHEPERVTETAGAWAARFGARADVAYVDPIANFAPLVRHADLRRSVQDQIGRITVEEQGRVDALAARLPAEARGLGRVWDGAGAVAIAERSAAYDLVLVGTHNRHGLVHLVLGSSAERIARWSHAPVLVVRNAPPASGARVLVAIDLRDHAEVVLDQALPYAKALGATVDLVFVEDPVNFAPLTMEAPVIALVAEHVARRKDHDEGTMRALLERVPAAARGRATVEEGEPGRRIGQLASGYDLVITGTHGRTGLDRWWLGSVAENILRSAERSVLVVHLQAAGGDAEREGANGDAQRS